MKLVLLAAGHGRRFGGLKQIAPVGPHGEAIMDYTAHHAQAAGYDGVVVVVREEIRDEIVRHLVDRWDLSIPVDIAVQPDRPGTAYAVLSAQPYIRDCFAVANADDLYEIDALAMVRRHVAPLPTPARRSRYNNVLITYELGKTILTDAEVKRGICRVDSGGMLEGVAEHTVCLREDGDFDAVPLDRVLSSCSSIPAKVHLGRDVQVSMNLWGFTPAIFDVLADVVAPFEPCGPGAEVLLPEVVGTLVASDAMSVHVDRTSSRCFGVTHREDIELVRDHLDVMESGARPSRLGSDELDVVG